MAYFTHMSTLVGGSFTHVSGITDLEVFEVGGVIRLYSASFSDGGLHSFTLSDGQAAVYCDCIGASAASGTYGATKITVGMAKGQEVLLPSGKYDDRAAVHSLDSGGRFEKVSAPTGDASHFSQFVETQFASFANRTYVFGAQAGKSGISTYNFQNNLNLNYQRKTADNDTIHIGDVVDLELTKIGSRSYLFAASAMDAGVSVFRVSSRGQLTHKDSVGPADGSGFSFPSVIEVTKSAGKNYLLMGASGTGSISVFSVSYAGKLVETDYKLDDTHTRFGGVTAITSFQYADRTFVVAGGSDDGLTLFELNPGGTLFTLATIEDQQNTCLTNVQAIAAHVFAGQIQIFAAGESEAGISQFSIDLGAVGSVQIGKRFAEVITGGAGDDLIYGKRGRDTLSGGAGNDRIMDGSGKDKMSGGSGADVFVFDKDGVPDTVTDFELHTDRLDLSAFPMLYHYSDVQVQIVSWGYRLWVQGEKIVLLSADGHTSQFDVFTQDDFIF